MVAADRMEFAGLRRHLGGWIRLQWPVGFSAEAEWNGKRLVLLANGPGPALAGEAADAALERGAVSQIASVGFCGALHPDLESGEVFVAGQVRAIDGGKSYTAKPPKTRKRFRSGVLLSGDRVIQTVAEKRELRAAGGDAVDMEAAAVAERADRRGIPFFCIRTVTDRADEGFAVDLNAARDENGRFRRGQIVWHALRRPVSGIPELIRLERRSRLAARTVGDFLAACQF